MNCEFTIYAPDPQQCPMLAEFKHNGEYLCTHHYKFTVWAEAHQDD